MSAEKPILFSGPMVRAILEGRKTQTRRVAKHPLAVAAKRIHSYKGQTEFDCVLSDDTGGIIHCPYGAPGDHLWVRETWGLMSHHDPTDWCDESITGVPEGEIRERYSVEHADNWRLPNEAARWRPSIHMPRWASRITLEITDVRVERLQEISADDAEKEGCGFGVNDETGGPVARFRTLWQSINGPDSWTANPWVWVISFRRIQ